jgi:hypothetical protein
MLSPTRMPDYGCPKVNDASEPGAIFRIDAAAFTLRAPPLNVAHGKAATPLAAFFFD